MKLNFPERTDEATCGLAVRIGQATLYGITLKHLRGLHTESNVVFEAELGESVSMFGRLKIRRGFAERERRKRLVSEDVKGNTGSRLATYPPTPFTLAASPRLLSS